MDLGAEVDPGVLTPGTIPLPRADGESVVAEVLWIDRFGNCQLNLGPDDLEEFDGFKDVEQVSLRLGDPTAPTGVVTRTAVRSSSFAGTSGGIGLVLDSYGCWRSASIAARPPTSSASGPVTSRDHAAHRSVGRQRHSASVGPDRADPSVASAAMRPATTLTLALLLVLILVAGLISLARL